jgi:hypothetical protein
MTDENHNWLNNEIINCSNTLEVIDQSPFDPDLYLYCTGCRNRLDISRYDKHWKLIAGFTIEPKWLD